MPSNCDISLHTLPHFRVHQQFSNFLPLWPMPFTVASGLCLRMQNCEAFWGAMWPTKWVACWDYQKLQDILGCGLAQNALLLPGHTGPVTHQKFLVEPSCKTYTTLHVSDSFCQIRFCRRKSDDQSHYRDGLWNFGQSLRSLRHRHDKLSHDVVLIL